jgi:hypothetical protein
MRLALAVALFRQRLLRFGLLRRAFFLAGTSAGASLFGFALLLLLLLLVRLTLRGLLGLALCLLGLFGAGGIVAPLLRLLLGVGLSLLLVRLTLRGLLGLALRLLGLLGAGGIVAPLLRLLLGVGLSLLLMRLTLRGLLGLALCLGFGCVTARLCHRRFLHPVRRRCGGLRLDGDRRRFRGGTVDIAIAARRLFRTIVTGGAIERAQ